FEERIERTLRSFECHSRDLRHPRDDEFTSTRIFDLHARVERGTFPQRSYSSPLHGRVGCTRNRTADLRNRCSNRRRRYCPPTSKSGERESLRQRVDDHYTFSQFRYATRRDEIHAVREGRISLIADNYGLCTPQTFADGSEVMLGKDSTGRIPRIAENEQLG